jgi:uncharacterized Zn-binding protein involved in type VI secretion
MALIGVQGGISIHTGSTLQGPVAGVAFSLQSFVTIEGASVLTLGSIMATPSHIYAYADGTPLYHSHSQSIITSLQSFVTIEGVPVSLEGDNSISNLTVLSVAGQDFVTIS